MHARTHVTTRVANRRSDMTVSLKWSGKHDAIWLESTRPPQQDQRSRFALKQRVGAAEHLADFVTGQVPAGSPHFLAIGIEDEGGNGGDSQRLDTSSLASEIDRLDVITLFAQLGDRRLRRTTRTSRIGRDIDQIAVLRTRLQVFDDRVPVPGQHDHNRQEKRSDQESGSLLQHASVPETVVRNVGTTSLSPHASLRPPLPAAAADLATSGECGRERVATTATTITGRTPQPEHGRSISDDGRNHHHANCSWTRNRRLSEPAKLR